MKKFILNADDFGLTEYHNKAVSEGYKAGILTSASLCVNTEAFYEAANEIIPKCSGLGIGIHLNIMEGRCLTPCHLLTDNHKYFNRGYLYLVKNQNKKEFLNQIEDEFRAQIEKCLKYVEKVDHIDSHVHTHAIPTIFDITCKLAKEYNIKYIRTQYEKTYIIPSKFLNSKFFINLIKIRLLQHYTNRNKKTVEFYGLNTNDCIIGIGYTGMMDAEAILEGLKAAENSQITEALIHPCKYNDKTYDSHCVEFDITQNEKLKEEVLQLGFEFTNYKHL